MADKFLEEIKSDLESGAPKETPTEIPKEQDVIQETPKEPETPPEQPKEVPKETPKDATPQTGEFGWGKINELLGRDETNSFKDADGFKTFFDEMNEKIGKATEYEQSLNDYRTKEQEYKTVMDYITQNEGKFDPLNSVFNGDADAYKRHYLAEGLKNEGYNRAVVDKILGADLDNMNALDVIALGRQLKSKRLTGKDEQIKRMAVSELGVDLKEAAEEGKSFNDVLKELTPEQQLDLDAEADEITNSIKDALSKVEVPEPANPIKQILEQSKTQREKAHEIKQSWEGKEATQKLGERLDVLKLSHEGFEFDYKMSEADKTELAKSIAVEAAVFGREFNEENMDALVQVAKERYIGKNASKLLSAALKQAEVKSKEQIEKDVYNGKKPDISREKKGDNSPDPFQSAAERLFTNKDITQRK